MPDCRNCQTNLNITFCDLGMSPVSNNFLNIESLARMEPYYPLHAYVCEECFLVQLEIYETPEKLFTDDYAYYSSYSETWLNHAQSYASMMIENFNLTKQNLVIEIASNDGYLLKNFVKSGIPVLGIEPANNVAESAREAGINTIDEFFNVKLAKKLVSDGISADILIGNNVLAHVPDINNFVSGMKYLLSKDGIITMEFPHLLQLIRNNQFDTIYHEHFSYLSFTTVNDIFSKHDLTIFDVQELDTHGGSLRIYARHDCNDDLPVRDNTRNILDMEDKEGIRNIDTYSSFSDKVEKTKRNLLSCLIDIKNRGKIIAGYGAPAKGNTLMNYCGIGMDFIEFTVDRSIQKQGRYLPGTHIPVFSPEAIQMHKPDYILILPWNLKDEIIKQLDYVKEWGCKFIVPIPELWISE